LEKMKKKKNQFVYRHRRATAACESLLPFAVAKAADFNVVKDGGVFDVNSAAFAKALRCMRIVDTDRLLWMRPATSSD
jgi:hypothetical protein